MRESAAVALVRWDGQHWSELELRVRRAASNAESVLLWGLADDVPNDEMVAELLAQPDHVWHAGLRLGVGGLPRALDFVAPTWRFHRDADPAIESMSWRVSLRACLLRSEAIEAVDGLDTGFETETAAGLDLGRRLLSAGALLRHVPSLVPDDVRFVSPAPTARDEMRFVARNHGRKWALWATIRAGRPRTVGTVVSAWRARRATVKPLRPRPPRPPLDAKVTVLIPTIERYPYLRTVLDQLRHQTITPHEVIVVDQTPVGTRDAGIETDFADLPLRALFLDRAGQSTARNAGLRIASGDTVLFIDDDDEIEPDLIRRHLSALAVSGIDVSCGIAHEPKLAVQQPRWRQASAAFPTNNAMVTRSALDRSGLFDLAFDHGIRADADLGMRLYLAGCRLVLDPDIDVIHHRAPRGGLRQIGERKTTFTGSRASLVERQKLSPTEVYLARRYFTEQQAREMVRLRFLGGFSSSGGALRRVARIVVQSVLAPSTKRQHAEAWERATRLLVEYPQIEWLPSADGPAAAHKRAT